MGHAFTDHRHGDLALGADPLDLAARRAAVVDRPWTWIRQVHGARVVTVTEPGQHAGAEADAIVTAVPGAAIAVLTADCAPVLLVADGAVGVVHAGWRGLAGGVVEAAVEALVTLGYPPLHAVLGPCIRGRCYEFGSSDLDQLADRYGPTVRSTTAWGTPALDVAAGIGVVCASFGIELLDESVCTACSSRHWSHRARGDSRRQALVAWIGP